MTAAEGYTATYPDGQPIRLGHRVKFRDEQWTVRTIRFHWAPDAQVTPATVDLYGIGARAVGWPDAHPAELEHDPEPLSVAIEVDDAESLLAWIGQYVAPLRDSSGDWSMEIDEDERAAFCRLADAITTAADLAP